MTTKAQRLADRLQKHGHAEEAALLRRLHEANAELLEALQDFCDTLGECGMTEKARAAIAKATGEQT